MDMVKGYMYRIQTITGRQKYPREHLLTYLGENLFGDLSFSARPIAGTLSISKADIISIAPVRPGTGGGDSQSHYLNKIVK